MTDAAALLPGEWEVRATNFPMWLTGRKLAPRFSYGLLGDSPLRLSDRVTYETRSGKQKHIVGTDVLNGETFEWRGRGLLRFFVSRWRIVDAAADDLLLIEFEKTLATPAGRDVIARKGVSADRVAQLAAGLTVL